MRRYSALLFFVCAAIVATAPAATAQGYTTRIETRPFYGASVTLEHGVRVIRPLPPERQVIINPDNATALSLSFNETRVYENRTIHNYHQGERRGYGRRALYGATGGYYGLGYGYGRRGYGPNGYKGRFDGPKIIRGIGN